MLANIMCWVFVLGLMFSDSLDRRDLYIKCALSIGFIFVGVLSKAVDYYREIHVKK